MNIGSKKAEETVFDIIRYGRMGNALSYSFVEEFRCMHELLIKTNERPVVGEYSPLFRKDPIPDEVSYLLGDPRKQNSTPNTEWQENQMYMGWAWAVYLIVREQDEDADENLRNTLTGIPRKISLFPLSDQIRSHLNDL